MSLLASLSRLLGTDAVHPLIQQNHRRCKEIDQNAPLEEVEFVVLDTELTGFSINLDEIVSIGAVRISGMRLHPAESFQALVDPARSLPKESTLVHRITPEAVKGRPPLRDVLPDLLHFLGGAMVVGHHVDLDMRFLNHACQRELGGMLRNPCLDTLRLAMIFEEDRWDKTARPGGEPSYQLSHLATRYGLPAFDAHDAMQDALQTAYLFLYLVRSFRQGGIRTLRDLRGAGRDRGRFFHGLQRAPAM